MTLRVPDLWNVTNGANGLDFQCHPDLTDWEADAAAVFGGIYAVSGLTVSGTGGMAVRVGPGCYVIDRTHYTFSGGGPYRVAPAGSSDRRDIVTVNARRAVVVTRGPECGTAGWTRRSPGPCPAKPATLPGHCLIAEVGVPAGTTEIRTAVHVVDKTARWPYYDRLYRR